MTASDYRAVPGTRRARFINAAGHNISRRAYENLRSREKGYPSYRAYQVARQQKISLLPGPHAGNDEYDRLLGFYSKEQKRSRAFAMAPGSEFNELFRAAYVRPDGSIRSYFDSQSGNWQPDADITKQVMEDLYWLLYACGFVGVSDFGRYVRY